MYACLHIPALQSFDQELLGLALDFSPTVEHTSNNTVVFSIDPLRKLIGSPHQIASEICRAGYEHKLQANLAIASNPDTAILLARHSSGVTLVTPGEEKFKLASVPLASLFTHDVPVDPNLLEILYRWGLKTCEDLVALPEQGVAERLGKAGVYLRNLAWGVIHRPLHIAAPLMNYEQRMELEHPLELLEPLLFLLGRALTDLCQRLRSQSQAARSLEAQFELEAQRARMRAPSQGRNPQILCGARLIPRPFCASSSIAKKEYRCELEFPVPLSESHTLLKLLQLHMERHLPEAPILAFTVRLKPADPKRIQVGIFFPPSPPPDKLQLTLARIAGMVGKENVGAPALLNTHRPDAFEMTTLDMSSPEPQSIHASQSQILLLAIRLFRPPLHARVKLNGSAPKNIAASGVKGNVLRSAGPWKTSGEWWVSTCWMREEWDIELDDGALYRIYQDVPTHEWYVNGVYD